MSLKNYMAFFQTGYTKYILKNKTICSMLFWIPLTVIVWAKTSNTLVCVPQLKESNAYFEH